MKVIGLEHDDFDNTNEHKNVKSCYISKDDKKKNHVFGHGIHSRWNSHLIYVNRYSKPYTTVLNLSIDGIIDKINELTKNNNYYSGIGYDNVILVWIFQIMENSLVFSVLVIKVDVLNNSHYLAQGTSTIPQIKYTTSSMSQIKYTTSSMSQIKYTTSSMLDKLINLSLKYIMKDLPANTTNRFINNGKHSRVSSYGACADSETCCSEYGYCGNTGAYCVKGCQPQCGICSAAASTKRKTITTTTKRKIPISTAFLKINSKLCCSQ
ncbi:hypothetical protein U3516DRAFT_739220 [Neocallimastix sp. 'constans']